MARGLLRIGVDVGGTNTDAALLEGNAVLATVKSPTTANVTDGVANAIHAVLAQVGVGAHVEAQCGGDRQPGPAQRPLLHPPDRERRIGRDLRCQRLGGG